MPHADDTFEAKAQGAERVKRIENVVWALTATCDKGDDTEQRQCRRVRDTRAGELAGATLLVDADADAFDIGRVRCQAQVDDAVADAVHSLRGRRGRGQDATSRSIGGSAKLYDNAKAFSDEAAAKAWAKSVGNARVQMLVKVPAKAVSGTTVQARHRRLSRVGAVRRHDRRRESAVGAGRVRQEGVPCGRRRAGGGPSGRGAHPTRGLGGDAAGGRRRAEVLREARVAGKAKLKITVAGDGTIARYEQQGDFANTPTGACIDKALEKARFPANGKQKTTINFPLTLP